jgi:hypothetical protein
VKHREERELSLVVVPIEPVPNLIRFQIIKETQKAGFGFRFASDKTFIAGRTVGLSARSLYLFAFILVLLFLFFLFFYLNNCLDSLVYKKAFLYLCFFFFFPDQIIHYINE